MTGTMHILTSALRERIMRLAASGYPVVVNGDVKLPIDGVTITIHSWYAASLFLDGVTAVHRQDDGTWVAYPDDSSLVDWDGLVGAVETINAQEQVTGEVQ